MLLRCCLCTFAITLALSAQIGGRGGIGFNPGGPMQPGVNQAPPATDCAASGTVVNAVTGEPIARAMVSLSGQSNSGSATDSNGQWSVTNQTCGFINPTATRPGFISGSYGQEFPQSARRRPELVSGSPMRDLKITLMPEGVISGRVQDENGDPIEGAQITVARVAVMNGERAMVNMGGGFGGSDSQGNFRTERLPPGRYIVCAQSSERTFPAGGGEAMVYAGDCYPGPISAGPAGAVPLEGGRELRVGLTLRSTPGLHIRGTVSGLPAGQRGAVNLTRVVSQGRGGGLIGMMAGSNARPGIVTPDGTFDISSVTSGTYVARIAIQTQPGSGANFFAEQEVSVGSSDIDNLHLALEPAGSVNGTVRVALTNPTTDKPEASKPNLNVNLNPQQPGIGGVNGPMQWDADHLNFTFPKVQSGQYYLNANVRQDSGTYIKSTTLNGQDVLNQPFTVNGNTGPIEIVVSDDSGTFTANVTDANDQPISAMIILKPTSGPTITAAAGDDGKVTRNGLPAGEYHVWAFDDIRNIPYNEDEWMTQHAGPAQTVTVSASGSANITLKRIAAPAEP